MCGSHELVLCDRVCVTACLSCVKHLLLFGCKASCWWQVVAASSFPAGKMAGSRLLRAQCSGHEQYSRNTNFDKDVQHEGRATQQMTILS
jgi:hypothetical protein